MIKKSNKSKAKIKISIFTSLYYLQFGTTIAIVKTTIQKTCCFYHNKFFKKTTSSATTFKYSATQNIRGTQPSAPLNVSLRKSSWNINCIDWYINSVELIYHQNNNNEKAAIPHPTDRSRVPAAPAGHIGFPQPGRPPQRPDGRSGWSDYQTHKAQTLAILIGISFIRYWGRRF